MIFAKIQVPNFFKIKGCDILIFITVKSIARVGRFRPFFFGKQMAIEEI